MSRTLSKILVICALVVVLPLMVVGTAFAAYYSINATVSIEVFIDQIVDEGVARVTYKEDTGTVDKKLEVTDGHLKEVTFRASAVGYDFVGWYAGTYKEYVNALESDGIDESDYVIKTQNATVEMTDYQNLVAVFKAKTYRVSFDYAETPEGVLGSGTLPDEDYVYGDDLPTVTYEGHPEWTFDGWYAEGDTETKYTKATFEESGNIVLTGNWVDSARITITYLDDEGEEISGSAESIYANQKVTLDDPMTYQANYSEGFVANGYSYGWQNVETGEIITEVTSDKDVRVQIVKSPVVYTARVEFNSDDLTLNSGIEQELTFSVENRNSLDVWADSSNWQTEYSFWTFDGLTYNSEEVTSLQDVIDRVISENPHTTTEIVLTATARPEVTSISASVDYVSNTGINYDGSVYRGEPLGQLTEEENSWDNLEDMIFNALGLCTDGSNLDTFYGNDRSTVVTPTSMAVTAGDRTVYPIFGADLSTLNDLVEYIYQNIGDVAEGGKLSLTIVVYFD